MNTFIENAFWIILGLLIISLFVLQFSGSRQNKGVFGESKVRAKLGNIWNEEYYTINDALLPYKNGTCQIDHMIISVHGIVVIETKTYSGWIYGSENAEYWTQSIYGSKTKFRNPIKQNWSHILALKDILCDYQEAKYYPIVVFVGSAELKSIHANVPVVYDNELVQEIRKYESKYSLSIEQVRSIEKKLNEINLKDRSERIKHEENIKKEIENKGISICLGICPKCGGKLILRNGKYGEFYGCERFPDCRFRKSI